MKSPEALVLDALVLVALPAVVGYLLSQAVGNAVRRRGWAPFRVRTLRIVITIAWVALAAAGAAVTLGTFSFLSALTVSAVAGIAVTLALQTTLQNLISGFVLIQQRFLRLGDSIQFSGIKGTVVSIGLLDVIVRTDGGALALVSNSNLLSGPLVNFTAATRLSGEY